MPPLGPRAEAEGVDEVDRVVEVVAVEVESAVETDRVFRCPAPAVGIVIPRAEPHQTRVRVVQPARKAERLKTGIAVKEHVAEFIVINPLNHSMGRYVNNKPRTAQMIRDDAVGVAAFCHVGGDVRSVAVDEYTHDVVVGSEFGDGIQAVRVEEAFHEGAVELLPDTPVHAVDHVLDFRLVRQGDAPQIPQHVVLVDRLVVRRIGLALELAVFVVGIRKVAIGEKPILRVVRAVERAAGIGVAQAVAVRVESVRRDRDVVLLDLFQTVGIGIVDIIVRMRDAVDRLGFFSDPSEYIPRVKKGRIIYSFTLR